VTRTAWYCGALAFVCYWSTLQAPVNGDATAHVYLAYSLVWHGSPDVSGFAASPYPFVFTAIETTRGTIIQYVPGNAILFAPLALLGGLAGIPAGSYTMTALATKLVASVAVALSIALLFPLLARRAGPRAAVFLTVAYALGTAAFSVSSQVFLQHGPTLALTCGALRLLTGTRPSRIRVGIAALLGGLLILVRLSNVILAGIGLAFVVHRRRYALPHALFWAIGPLLLLAAYDWATFGEAAETPGGDLPVASSPLEGVAALLISPSRGLLVYSPFLIVGIAALMASWRWRADDGVWLLRYASLGFVATLLGFGIYRDWLGGWNFGNRYLTDLLPFYMLGIAEAWRRGWLAAFWARAVFSVAVGWSILLHAAGAGLYYFFWNGRHWDVTPDIFETPWRVWDWTASQWEWVLARAVLDPPPSLFVEAVVLAGCLALFARMGSRAEAPPPG
jgi:hypothetical protein